jgi:hypothetical protein
MTFLKKKYFEFQFLKKIAAIFGCQKQDMSIIFLPLFSQTKKERHPSHIGDKHFAKSDAFYKWASR